MVRLQVVSPLGIELAELGPRQVRVRLRATPGERADTVQVDFARSCTELQINAPAPHPVPPLHASRIHYQRGPPSFVETRVPVILVLHVDPRIRPHLPFTDPDQTSRQKTAGSLPDIKSRDLSDILVVIPRHELNLHNPDENLRPVLVGQPRILSRHIDVLAFLRQVIRHRKGGRQIFGSTLSKRTEPGRIFATNPSRFVLGRVFESGVFCVFEEMSESRSLETLQSRNTCRLSPARNRSSIHEKGVAVPAKSKTKKQMTIRLDASPPPQPRSRR